MALKLLNSEMTYQWVISSELSNIIESHFLSFGGN